ncbi:MAG: YhdH/YhfP family quinone oxidoreductase [Stagnimonas sp.]|nr:YhdH/YhfP family quinone oxidoreductase [Stagnimonas sp.]
MSIIRSSFRALRVRSEGGHQASFEHIGLDALSAGEVVIRVAYSGINYKDALAVTGKGRILRGSPRTPGIDLSGVVVQSGDSRYPVGAKVLVTGCNIGEQLDGGYSEYARLPAEAIVPLPQGLSLAEAMAIGTAGFTAALALRRMLENHQAPAMGSILVSGPTGGVGSIAIALLKREGFHVTALTGKPEAGKDYLTALGADSILDRNHQVMGSKPLETALWGGAIDNLGGPTLNWLTRTVKPWGNIASIGLAQAHTLETTVMPFILRGVSILGIHSVECPRPWRLALWEKLRAEWKPAGLMEHIVSRTVSLDELPAACAQIVAGQVTGRTLVRVAGD